MESYLRWITAISSLITAIGIFLVVWQVRVNHDKSRREYAIKMLQDWDKVISPNFFRYANLMFALNADQIKNIKEGRGIKVERQILEQHLPEFCIGSDEYIELNHNLTIEIRHSIIRMLNSIENIGLAYKHRVADREIIEEAFEGFFFGSDFLGKCSQFISEFSWGSWPVIDEIPKLMKPAKFRKSPS